MSSVLSYVGWAILPGYATSILQNIYYGLTIRAGDHKPRPGTPRFNKHRRSIFISVVTLYLFYTIYETLYEVCAAGDFYSVLGVSPLADERSIKSRFRRLAAQHHPDKLNQHQHQSSSSQSSWQSSSSSQSVTDNFFVYLKLAQDTLLDPATRFAYDRFGPQVVEWTNLSSAQEFLYAGLKQGLAQYFVGLGTILVLNWVYWSPWGRYWRFYTFAALVILEFVLVTQPFSLVLSSNHIPAMIQSVFGLAGIKSPSFLYLLPFQIISVARRIAITVHIFISQITPLYVSRQTASTTTPSQAGSGAAAALQQETLQRLGQLTQLSRMAEKEASGLLELSLSPFRGDRESVSVLRRGMKEGLVLGSVRNMPEVQEAVAQVQRRAAAAAGS